jgi:hypothetical protein
MDFNNIFNASRPLQETPAGNIVGYHGTSREFGKPTAVISSHTKRINFGPGFYFATDEADAASFGSTVYRADLVVERPLNVYRSNNAREDPVMLRIQRAFKLSDEDAYSFEEPDRHPMRILMEKAELLIDVGVMSAGGILKFLQKIGYDGIIIDRDIINYELKKGVVIMGEEVLPTRMRGDFVVVFSPEQILTWEKFGNSWERDAARFR